MLDKACHHFNQPRLIDMSTTTLHISLPLTLKQYVKERVAEEYFSNPSD